MPDATPSDDRVYEYRVRRGTGSRQKVETFRTDDFFWADYDPVRMYDTDPEAAILSRKQYAALPKGVLGVVFSTAREYRVWPDEDAPHVVSVERREVGPWEPVAEPTP